MSYLERLKQKTNFEKGLCEVLPKLPKGGSGEMSFQKTPIGPTAKTAKRAFGSKDSTPDRHLQKIAFSSDGAHGNLNLDLSGVRPHIRETVPKEMGSPSTPKGRMAWHPANDPSSQEKEDPSSIPTERQPDWTAKGPAGTVLCGGCSYYDRWYCRWSESWNRARGQKPDEFHPCEHFRKHPGGRSANIWGPAPKELI